MPPQEEIIGYLFDGRFYKMLDELAGRTMSEYIRPTPVYNPSYVEALINKHEAIMKILMADN
jgi:hypothetical protein